MSTLCAGDFTMADPCAPLPTLHLDNTLGAAYIGNIIAAILYGLTSVQTYIFFDRYNDDHLLRSLVSFLWVLDSAHLALICHTIYFYSITNFANPFAMLSLTRTIVVHVIVTGVSDVTIRGIFAYRVLLISQSKRLLVAAIVLPSLVCFAGSIAFSVRALQIGTYAGLSDISWIMYSAFATGVTGDVTIAASLCYFLAKCQTGIRRTDSIVQLLMMYSVNTGILTSACAICVLITYAVMPGNFIFIAFYFVLPKLFLSSLLATLNAREKLRGLGKNSDGAISLPVSIPLTSAVICPNRASVQPSSASSDRRLFEIQIQTTTDMRSHSIQDMTEEKWEHLYHST